MSEQKTPAKVEQTTEKTTEQTTEQRRGSAEVRPRESGASSELQRDVDPNSPEHKDAGQVAKERADELQRERDEHLVNEGDQESAS